MLIQHLLWWWVRFQNANFTRKNSNVIYLISKKSSQIWNN